MPIHMSDGSMYADEWDFAVARAMSKFEQFSTGDQNEINPDDMMQEKGLNPGLAHGDAIDYPTSGGTQDGMLQDVSMVRKFPGATITGPEMGGGRGAGGGGSGPLRQAPNYANTNNKPTPRNFPEGYLDKVPMEQKLSRTGISHPGFRWEVYDRQTGKVVRKDLGTSVGASRAVDRLDNQYGGYRYSKRPVRTNKITEEETKLLKELGLDLDF